MLIGTETSGKACGVPVLKSDVVKKTRTYYDGSLTHGAVPGLGNATKVEEAVRLENGEFVYDDHLAPWSVTAPNLNFSIVRDVGRDQFVGNAKFSEGRVKIMNFEPMRADFATRFRLEGSTARLLSLDLRTDGAHSRHVEGSTCINPISRSLPSASASSPVSTYACAASRRQSKSYCRAISWNICP